MSETKDFSINATGDFHQLFDALRDYDWGVEDKVTRKSYMDRVIDSRMRFDDDDPDSEVSVKVVPDGLDQLAEIIRRWLPVAREISLHAYGSNDQAVFDMSMRCRYGKHEIVLAHCRSQLKDKQGKLAEAAVQALNLLTAAAKGDAK